MKKTLLAAAATVALSAGSAFAADLPSKKAPEFLPPPPPPPLWTGFYVGLNAGYTWEDNRNVPIVSGAIPPFTPAIGWAGTAVLGTNTDGFIGGGQIGYNYQFGNSFVVGVEADIQGIARDNGTVAALGGFGPIASSFSASKTLDYLGTVRGRVGYLVTPTLLVYGTGGFAYGQGSLNTSLVQTVGPFVGISGVSFSDTRVGWTAGGGVEWLFLPNWSAKVEYLYYDLGTVTTLSPLNYSPVLGLVGWTTSTGRFNGHVVRAGVNYHFNLFEPAPVVAKY
jgi:outer membrane immunogenic protein